MPAFAGMTAEERGNAARLSAPDHSPSTALAMMFFWISFEPP
jgi:hypothetical protein